MLGVMCGVFGFVSRDNTPVNLGILNTIAKVTMKRGPHAWGLAWIDGRGRLFAYKQAGKVIDHLGMLTMAADAWLLIGHCRFATIPRITSITTHTPRMAAGSFTTGSFATTSR
jgi:glutamine phosphoribosylpyrophosphate amidotransferase